MKRKIYTVGLAGIFGLLFLSGLLQNQGFKSIDQSLAVGMGNKRIQFKNPCQQFNMGFGKIPLYFIPNKGQVDKQVLYYAKSSRCTLWITRKGMVFDSVKYFQEKKSTELWNRISRGKTELADNQPIERDVYRLVFINANKKTEVIPVSEAGFKVNYMTGSNREKWRTNIPSSKGILYKEIYDRIDLKVYGNKGHVEYDWIVSPGGNPDDIRFEFQDVIKTEIDKNGDLIVKTRSGKLIQRQPVAFQKIKGKRKKIDVEFERIEENRYGLNLGKYDNAYKLVIDPLALVYSTFLRGYTKGIAVDSSGSVYFTGSIYSSDFPTTPGAFDTSYNGKKDAFVIKFSPSGKELEYASFLGGNDYDEGLAIAVDSKGAVYVTGWTSSSDFPTTPDAFNAVFSGDEDTFGIKINPLGSALEYSGFLGGSEKDRGQAVAIDTTGAAYIAGWTSSPDFPVTPGAFDSTLNGWRDGYVTKLNPSGSALEYSTLLGGNYSDELEGIAVDKTGSAYVTGNTDSKDFPSTPGAFSRKFDGFNMDGFVTKLNPLGSVLVYSTAIGGGFYDRGLGIAIDKTGAAYITGGTNSADFPTTQNAFDRTFNGDVVRDNADVFITKVNPEGSALEYSTYVGGNYIDFPWGGIVVDSKGAAYVAGETLSGDFPTTPDAETTAINKVSGHPGYAFFLKLNPEGSTLVYSTYLGGERSDLCRGLKIDNTGAVYLMGWTSSSDFPITQGAYYNSMENNESFFAKFLNSNMTLQIIRAEERAWIITKEYAKLKLIVENSELRGQTSKFIIYRKGASGMYEIIKEIFPSELQGGTYAFNDSFLEKDKLYTYVVIAVDPKGIIIGSTNASTI